MPKSLFYLSILLISLGISCRNQETWEKDLKGEQSFYHGIGLLSKNPDSARSVFLAGFSKLNQQNLYNRYLGYEFNRQYFYVKKEVLKTLFYADSTILMLRFARGSGWRPKLAQAYLNKGEALLSLKRYDEAYQSYYEAKSIAKSLSAERDQMAVEYDVYAQIANINYGQARFREAISWYNRAIEVVPAEAASFQLSYKVQGALDNIGLCYQFMGIPDTALFYYNRAEEAVNRIPGTDAQQKKDLMIARAVIMGNKGYALQQLGRLEAAVEAYQYNIRINGQPGYAPQDALLTRIKLADLFLKMQRTADAEHLVREISSSMDALPDELGKLEFILLKARIAKVRGQFATSGELFERFVDGYLAMRRKNTAIKNSDLKSEFELLDKNLDLALLTEANRNKKYYVAALLLICVLITGIAITIYKSKARLRRLNRQVKMHNQQLEVVVGAYEKSSLENDRLKRMMAHDLRSPVGAMRVFTSMMLDKPDRDDEDVELLKMMGRSAEQMESLIKELLFSKIEPGSDQESCKAVSIYSLLKENIRLMQYKADAKKLSLKLSCAGDAKVMVNEERIWRVVNNLLTNAIKYSYRGSEILVSCSNTDHEVVVAIRDSGIGIAQERLDSIFDLNPDKGRIGTEGEGSLGLGLYITREIVESHGGRIWVESQENRGTSFFFSLPAFNPPSAGFSDELK
ncbi:tetratricopeptide repeat-containing sensor histidine kinase [Pedobacter sp. JY14-1]|uniref:ATP-binding protein n=1 Tax=Pedobacter sp. JY14-1 TaxID=3034151 RepID=UPI0023E1E943|nr:tetratricopeptide repeat-containing sensor histidine kinase [Pedobacter sp. JY14-1]